MTPLTLHRLTVGSWEENCYVLADDERGECIVVDPGAEAERILSFVGGRRVARILLTHAHADHVGAVEAIRERTGAPVAIHAAELPLLGAIPHDELIADGDVIAWGAHQIVATHTPGHTPGMLTFTVGTDALVGDTLFAGGPGKTWSPEDFQTTLRTLREVVLGWPDETVCHPGHGESFRLGDLRPAIERFVAREHPVGFHGDAEW